MSADITDLRTQIGRDAYFNHLRRQMTGKTPRELDMQSAVISIQTSALKQAKEWMQRHYVELCEELNLDPTKEEIGAFSQDLVRRILSGALNTLSFDTSEVEKFMGPNWKDKL